MHGEIVPYHLQARPYNVQQGSKQNGRLQAGQSKMFIYKAVRIKEVVFYSLEITHLDAV